MLSHWFERGLGQVLAPDPSRPSLDETDSDAHGGVWDGLMSVVAPDPQFEASRHGDASHRREENKREDGSRPGREGGARAEVERRVEGRTAAAPTAEVTTAGEVECVHCYRMTPVPGGGNSSSTSASSSLSSPDPFQSPPPIPPGSHRTPHHSSRSSAGSSSDGLGEAEHLQLIASRSTNAAYRDTSAKWESAKKLLRVCAFTGDFSQKMDKRLRKYLASDPTLVWSRASDMGPDIKDGHTPMHAVAAGGNVKAAEILIEVVKGQAPAEEAAAQVGALFHARDLQGRAPLHVASTDPPEEKQLPMVNFIKKAMAEYPVPSLDMYAPDGKGLFSPPRGAPTPGRLPVGDDAPLDVGGNTAIGLALTSRERSARKNLARLEETLLSPGDRSVYGARTPAKDRTGGRSARRGGRRTSSDGGLMSPELSRLDQAVPEEDEIVFVQPFYGVSDMPGMRARMEDALCHHYPLIPPLCTGESSPAPLVHVGLFGVFDGHNDDRQMSQYLADNFAAVLQSTEEWKRYLGGTDALAQAIRRTCAQIDNDIRANVFPQHGGSTAIVAVVTDEAVLVANVGDCRCILVQRAQEVEVEAPQLVEEPSQQGEGLVAEAGAHEVVSSSDRNDGDVREQDKEPCSSEEHQGEKGAKGTEETSLSDSPQTPTPPPQSAPSAEESEERLAEVPEKPEGDAPMASAATASVSVSALSEDSKPNLEEERERIERAGLLVMPDVIRDPDVVSAETEGAEDNLVTLWKVVKGDPDKGDRLGMSRAFGDYDFKANADLSTEEQAVVCTPDLKIHSREGTRDLYLVLACDGVWDVMNNEEVGQFVHDRVESFRSESGRGQAGGREGADDGLWATVADQLLEECFKRGSMDNMTAVIVSLEDAPSVGTGYGRGTPTKLFAD